MNRSKHVSPRNDRLCLYHHSPIGSPKSEQDPEIRQIGIDDSLAPQPSWLLGLKDGVTHQEQGNEKRSSERGEDEFPVRGDEEPRPGGEVGSADIVGDCDGVGLRSGSACTRDSSMSGTHR